MRLLLISVVAFLAACESGSTSGSVPPAEPAHPISLAENRISESNVWISGGLTGLDWMNVRTTPRLAFGTQQGSGAFNDSIAVLGGFWEPDQIVTATVHTVNQQGGNVIEEVEILLRFKVTPHSARGYEINFRALNSSESYSEVVRWNGRLGNFTYLVMNRGQKFGITDGSVVKASITGNVITVYINDVQVSQVEDNTYKDGSPGMGFYLANASGVNSDFAFTHYTATGGP